jgi:RNA polymerase sigma factor (sigma-70 family)
MMDKNSADTVDRLYREQGARLYAWLARKADPESARDILHDAFFKACANLDAMEPIRDLAGWLWRCAAHALLDLWRSRKRRGPEAGLDEAEALLASPYANPAQEAERGELAAELDEALSRLPAEQREAIEALCIRGETLRAMAERTGLPIDTIASRKRYGLARLRKDLQDYE